MIEIIPKVKNMKFVSGRIDVLGGFRLINPTGFTGLERFIGAYFPADADHEPASMRIDSLPDLPAEGYRICIDEDGVVIAAAGRTGTFWALQTLRQLRDSETGTMPFTVIADEPDLPIRGFMLDISRDKIPTLASLQEIIDQLAAFKINHFELYVEGFSYAYPSFPEYWSDETPLTPADYEWLDAYCSEREIDFVPNQNGFGHMSAWLARPELHSLAECEEGYVAWGFPFPSSTLNPLDPRSLDLVRRMYADMMPHVRSRYFNINGDEPFELGLGKSKVAVEKNGKEAVYIQFIRQLCTEIKAFGKTPMMWGDVLIHHPEAIRTLPSDVLFIDWGYDFDYPFAAHTAMLSTAGVLFLAAPGTSSWNSFASRWHDMTLSTENAANGVKKHGGCGLLMTDWGDFGHLQYWPFSWPGLLYAAGCGWGPAPSEAAIIAAIDRHLAPKAAGKIGQAIVALAKYSGLEGGITYNATKAFQAFMYVDPSEQTDAPMKTAILRGALANSRIDLQHAETIFSLLHEVRNMLESQPPSLVRDEILQTADFIETGVHVNLVMNNDDANGHRQQRAAALLSKIVLMHERLWLARNRAGGLTRSLSRPIWLKRLMESPLPR
ncbi:MAG: family 20 glycosylhydrolase [bacterium]